MTREELAALIELAQRAHKSTAEALWLNALVRRLNAQPLAAQEPEEEGTKDDEPIA